MNATVSIAQRSISIAKLSSKFAERSIRIARRSLNIARHSLVAKRLNAIEPVTDGTGFLLPDSVAGRVVPSNFERTPIT